MSRVWSDTARFRLFLDIELAVCRAWAQRGRIPAEALRAIETRARIDMSLIASMAAVVHHEFIAFLSSLEALIGPQARFIHMGLTSSDITDTATAIQLVRSTDILSAEHRRLLAALSRASDVLPKSDYAAMLALEQRNIARLMIARRTIGVGKISGAVGTFATVPPDIEENVCSTFGIAYEPVSNQIVQRDRHAEYGTLLAIIALSLLDICSIVWSRLSPANEALFGNLRAAGTVCRAAAATLLQNIALWHERDISHSSAERLTLPSLTNASHSAARTARVVLLSALRTARRNIHSL